MIYERLETTTLLLQGVWDGELEDILLDDLAFAWGALAPTPTSVAWRGILLSIGGGWR